MTSSGKVWQWWAFSLGAVAIGCQNSAPALEPRPESDAGAIANDWLEELDAGAGAPPEMGEWRRPEFRDAPCHESEPEHETPDGVGQAGLYAVETVADVYWYDEVSGAPPAYDPGRGELRVTWISALSESCDGAGEIVAQICDLELPPVRATAAGAVYRLGVPEASWDAPDMPAYLGTTRTSAAGVEVPPLSAAIGIEVADNAAWPASDDTPFIRCSEGRTGGDCFVDHDGDGKPGIRLVAQAGQAMEPSGSGLTPVPVHAGHAYGRGAVLMYAGLRVTLGGEHPWGPDCEGSSGRAEPSGLELRVFDCRLDDGSPCSGAAAAYVDRTLPQFRALPEGETPGSEWEASRRSLDAKLDRQPSEGSRNRVVRLGDLEDDSACAAARGVFDAK